MRSRYRAGDWVEVRTKEEILSTLDEQGALERLPFMPEMLAFCGQRFRVAASAHKTCDTIHKSGGRRMRAAVHLEGMHCDGSAHEGCQARCTLFWKDAWLKPVADARAAKPVIPATPSKCDETRLTALTRKSGQGSDKAVFVCQATRLYDATGPLSPWSPFQYIDDVRSGNEAISQLVKVLFLELLFRMRSLPRGVRFTRWLHERVNQRLMGTPDPRRRGHIPIGQATPHSTLDLRPGEMCVVKTHDEILDTLDYHNRNRGLSFDKEMVRFCGGRYRVAGRVERIINEQTGEMMRMPTPSVILDGTHCTSRYSERRFFCPRRIKPFWREAWLERDAGEALSVQSPAAADRPLQ